MSDNIMNAYNDLTAALKAEAAADIERENEDRPTYTCECCGEVFDSEDDLTLVTFSYGSDELWCPTCIDNNAFRCERCDELHPNDERHYVTTANGRFGSWVQEEWCDSCVDSDASECEDCEELFESDLVNRHTLWNGDVVYMCDGCREDHYVYCDDCGGLVHADDAVYSDNGWDVYCPGCGDRHRSSENVLNYHHTGGAFFWLADGTEVPYWQLHDEDTKRLFLGIELETDDNDNKGDLADDIANEFGSDKVECKEDGSLGNEGLEIVSQPMETLYHLNSGMWERIVELVRNHDGLSYDCGSCGLHIHLSRAAFKDHDAVYRLDRLFHNFRDELVRFSRRSYNQLGHWCRLGDEDDSLATIADVAERKEKWRDKKRWAGRYEAVNDCNANTVEIRLWRGTLNVETLRATIEMTTGLAIVANSMTDELAETLTWPMLKLLVRFALESNGIPRDDLDAYLKRRNL